MNAMLEQKKSKVCPECGHMMKLYDKDENIRGLRAPKPYVDMFYGCENCSMAHRVDLRPESQKNKKLKGWCQ
jgi:RNase P subunit RPR2